MSDTDIGHGDQARLGADLARLRLSFGAKQSKIAAALKVDTSRISRIETGEITPDADEISKITRAIGTKEAKEYADYYRQVWSVLDKPPFWHPNRRELFEAEQQLANLDAFYQKSQTSETARAQAGLYKDTIVAASSYLRGLDHSIAFVGDIGVGKSTAICFSAGLLLPADPKAPGALSKRAVLETGSGRMTLCEVQLQKAGKDTFALVVYPHSQEEVFRTVSDFCASLIDAYSGPVTEQDGRGVSEEVNKALRNMAGLARKLEKGPDGKPQRFDPAIELVRSCHNGSTELTPEIRKQLLAEVTAEVLKRLKLEQRTTTEFRFEEASLVAGLRRLRELFASVNKGLRSDVSLPRRVDLIVPMPLLGSRPYNIRIIDTKGVDDTAIRPDIRAYLDDPRTLTVLCSRFNTAPDSTMQMLIQNLADTGAQRVMADNVVLLVLARESEIMDTQDDVGNRAETPEEGYRLKEDQVKWALAKIKGAENIPIIFFDVLHDEQEAITEALARQVEQMRQHYVGRIHEAGKAIPELIKRHGEEETKKAQAEVQRKLRIFIQQHLQLGAQTQGIHESLIYALKNTHARTVWATTTRNGSWPGLDAYHFLGSGTAIDAQNRMQPIFNALEGVLENMLGDETLTPAHDYLSELKRAALLWKDRFLADATASGREIFRAALFADDALWDDCANWWGTGMGFREPVARQIREWCDSHTELSMAVEKRVQQAWRDCFLGVLAKLCDSEDLLKGQNPSG